MSTTTSSSSVRKRRNSFSLSSFRKPAPPAPVAPPIIAEQAKARNAAAWQWLTRGIGDVVVPTKRPTPQHSLPPDHPKQPLASAAASPKDGGIVSTQQNQRTPIMPGLPRSPSRFKVEATAARSNGNSTGKSAASPGTSSPLYDEFELSGLRAHMMDFVHRLQENQKSNPEAAEDKKGASTPVAPVAPSHGIHPSTPVSSALHKFFNKVNFISSIMKSSKKSAPAPRVLVMPDEAPPDDEVNDQEDVQYHYHHYIHHHHHHYHYGRSPDAVGAVLGRHRRRSESSEALRPYIPSLWKAEAGDEVESPIKTFLDARCRRHSEDFLHGCYMQGKDQDSNNHADEFAMMGESVIKRKAQDSNNRANEFAMMGESIIHSSLQLPRKYNSARFTTPNKIQEPGHGNRMSKEEGDKDKEGRVGRQSGKSFEESIHTKMEEGKESGNGGAYDSTSRTRRHSAEIVMEANHYRTQRAPHAPPQRRHSEAYDAGYRAFVLEYASNGGRTKKAIRTPLPRLGDNHA